MKNNKSNVKKETLNLLRFLYEDEAPAGATETNQIPIGSIPVYVTDDIYDDVVEMTKGTIPYVSVHDLVPLNVLQVQDLMKRHNNLKPVNVPPEIAKKLQGSPDLVYTTLSQDEFTTGFANKFDKYLGMMKGFAKAHQGSLIGAGVGAGVTAAGWAAARAYLQRQLKNCETEKCREDIKAKIKKLNRIALMGGIGLTALGAAAQPLGTAIMQKTNKNPKK